MMVITRKLSEIPICENACPTCNGVGKTVTVPYSSTVDPWESVCDNCFGEKVISEDLKKRIELGAILRALMIDKYISMRNCAEKFGGTMVDWSDAKRGKSAISEIEKKIAQVKILPDSGKGKTVIVPMERPKLKTNFD